MWPLDIVASLILLSVLCSSLGSPAVSGHVWGRGQVSAAVCPVSRPSLVEPKTRRLEVNIVPRPRPSPNRPRIDPWSFISAGLTDRPGAKTVTSSPSSPRLAFQPSPTNPFTNCDPFPSPDCDPFNLRVGPSVNSDHSSTFDPFSAPFPTSRSAPCSTNGSPNLSLRVAPLNPADSPFIDLGWMGGTKDRVHPPRSLGLSPFRSPAPLRDDRFWTLSRKQGSMPTLGIQTQGVSFDPVLLMCQMLLLEIFLRCIRVSLASSCA